MSGRIGPVPLDSYLFCHADLTPPDEVELKSLAPPDALVQKQHAEVFDDWNGTNSGWVKLVVAGRKAKMKVFGVEAYQPDSLSRVDKVKRALEAFFSVERSPQVTDDDLLLLAPLGEEEVAPSLNRHELMQNARQSLESTCYQNRVQVAFEQQNREICLGGAPISEARSQ